MMIGAPIDIDDEVGDEIRSRRLDGNVDTLRLSDAAFGVADDPPHGVAGRSQNLT